MLNNQETMILFIKDNINEYYAMMLRDHVTRPLYLANASRVSPFETRMFAKSDLYCFDSSQERKYCLRQLGIEEEFIFTDNHDEYFDALAEDTVTPGIIVADTPKTIALALAQTKHEVLLNFSELTDANGAELPVFQDTELSLTHYYSMINYQLSSFHHLICSFDIPRHEFTFFPNNGTERHRIMRKGLSNAKLFDKMERKESAVVLSEIIKNILKKFYK